MKISDELRKFILGSFVLIFIISLIYILFLKATIDGDWEKTGVFGDSFGGLTSIFTGLAFAGVVYSMLQQNRMMEEQEKQMKRQEAEIKIQNEQTKESEKERAIDRFESKFFEMLKAQRELVQEAVLTKVQVSNKTKLRVTTNINGRHCFKELYDIRLFRVLSNRLEVRDGHFEPNTHSNGDLTENPLKGLATLKQVVDDFESFFFPKYQEVLGHYFRHLYHIVLMVENAPDFIDKTSYIRIIRAQTSTFESLLLFYNGLTSRGEKFKPLIEKYGILRGVDGRQLINGAVDKYDIGSYHPSAYGE